MRDHNESALLNLCNLQSLHLDQLQVLGRQNHVALSLKLLPLDAALRRPLDLVLKLGKIK